MNKVVIAGFFTFLLLASTASAITMDRADRFLTGDEKVYKFLGDEYIVKLIHVVPGGYGKAVVDVNGDRVDVTGDVPTVLGELKLNIKDCVHNEVTLDIFWEREDTKPDLEVYISESVQQGIEAKGKTYDLLLTNLDFLRMKAHFTVNGKEYVLGENEKTILKDKSVVKTSHFKFGTGRKSVKLAIWASDVKIAQTREEEYDSTSTFAEFEQRSLDIKGYILRVKIAEITKTGDIKLGLNDEAFVLQNEDRLELESGLIVKVHDVGLKTPKRATLGFIVSDELASSVEKKVYDKTIAASQKDSDRLEGIDITTLVIGMDDEEQTATLRVNGQDVYMGVGKQISLDGFELKLKRINPLSSPPKLQVSYIFTKEKNVAPKVEETEEDEEPVEDEKEETTETYEEETEPEETVEDEESEETPAKELEEVKEPVAKPKQSKVNSFFSRIGRFFKNLF